MPTPAGLLFIARETTVRQPLVILASTSPARRDALLRLGLRFEVVAPEVEEEIQAGESPAARALRLARLKARAVHARRPEAIVVAGDQTAVCGGVLLHKPRDEAEARASLRATSGRWIDFHTALAVHAPSWARSRTVCDRTRIRLRRLDEGEIRRYVALDRPLGCAGAFRAEGAGAALWASFRGDDPSAIVGLPLRGLVRCLHAAGLVVP
jgi:septum formation protein